VEEVGPDHKSIEVDDIFLLCSGNFGSCFHWTK